LLLGRKQFIGGLLADQFGLCFDGTVLGICLAQTFVAMPFFGKSALAAFQAVDEELEAVARHSGAPPWSVFWRIALPLASRGVAVGAVLAMARAAGEFGALLFLAPTPETAPIAVFNRFNSMGIAEVAPLVSLLLLLSLGTFLLLNLPRDSCPLHTRDPRRRRELVMSGPCNPPLGGEALQLRGVCIALGDFRLGPISFTLDCGDYLAIMGPGGCGKTTLLRTIAGILRPATARFTLAAGRR